MTVYEPDISEAMETYASQFDDLQVSQREDVLDLSAINPLSELREEWQNTTSDPTEHNLSTTSGVDERAYLKTNERGQYTSGYESQMGFGVRIPSTPSKDEVMRWGYYLTDANDEPLDGWYFGADDQGIFVCEVRAGSKTKVYQENWSNDQANGTGSAETNPSGMNLSLSKGNIFHVEFIYYGYGPVKMEVITDRGKVELHRFTHDGQTSVTNTNLPIRADIDNGSTSADALDLYVGGRQFSTIGKLSTSERKAGHYRDSLAVDDTKWYPVMSIKLKDGTDNIGSGDDYSHIIGALESFSSDTDATAYRWQVRRGTSPDSPTWENPSSHSDKPDETAMKVDTASTSITDGSGNLTGVFVDGGTLTSGAKNKVDIEEENPSSDITNGSVVTFVVRAVPGTSGNISEIFGRWTEEW
jgi:hypothetical protein